jgi:PAS domain S-box-containing protein
MPSADRIVAESDSEETQPNREAALRAAYAKLLTEKERVADELDLRTRALDASDTHILIIDTTKEGFPIVFANRAVAAKHGFAPEQLIGMRIEEFRRGGPQSAEIDAAIRDGRDFHTELVSKRPDGTPFAVEIAIVPVRDAAGSITHYVSFGSDITAHVRRKQQLEQTLDDQTKERERLEMELRLAQKLEAVGRLASGIAHEINTPIQYVGDSVHFLHSTVDDSNKLLAAYRQAVQQLAAGADSAAVLAELADVERVTDMEFIASETPKAFERTLDGIARVSALVRAMKEFAHPQGNEQNPADINHAIETTLAVASNEYKYVAYVTTELAEQLPPVVCNINEVNQVFLNLIVNAAHAIQASDHDATQGNIHIGTAVVDDCVEIVIRDNGCGIPQKNLDKIFEPFFTTKEVGKGTGQGLALARNIIVDKHGGDLTVRSTVGIGTSFIVRLPIVGKPPARP